MQSNDRNKRPERRERKPYEPPRVTSEQVFEVLALSCSSVGGACAHVVRS